MNLQIVCCLALLLCDAATWPKYILLVLGMTRALTPQPDFDPFNQQWATIQFWEWVRVGVFAISFNKCFQ